MASKVDGEKDEECQKMSKKNSTLTGKVFNAVGSIRLRSFRFILDRNSSIFSSIHCSYMLIFKTVSTQNKERDHILASASKLII